MLRAQLLNNHEGSAAVSAKSARGDVHVRVLPMGYEDYLKAERAYNQGALIQIAFPTLSSSDREFLKNGMTPLSWYNLFGGLEDSQEALDDLIEEGPQFMTPEQYQRVYSGERTLDEVYAYNRRQIEVRLADQSASPCP